MTRLVRTLGAAATARPTQFFLGLLAAAAVVFSTGCAQTSGALVVAEQQRQASAVNWPSPSENKVTIPVPAAPVALPEATIPEPQAATDAIPQKITPPRRIANSPRAIPTSRTAVPAPLRTAAAKQAQREPHRDVWERVRSGFQMRGTGDPTLVGDWEIYYSSRQDYFGQMINNSSHFLYHIASEVERRGMPLEIALLPMIESAYNPVAYSSAHASGIWQFIPSTGKHYGLKQNRWYDGRRDVIAATGAALDYLQVLYGMFNDWELALAAYNWGEGAVQRAVERNQAKGLGTDYLSLAAGMPAETRNYLPKLLAVKNIIANPARFGLTLAAVPNEPYFEVITVKRHMDVTLAARFAGMSVDEFKFLNPAHSRPVINVNSAETLVIPKHNVAAFMANMSQHESKPLVAMKTHAVRAGELPQTIAEQYGLSVDELNNLNNIGARRRIATGQILMVPNTELQPTLDDLPNVQAVSVIPAAYTRTVMQKVMVMQGGVRRTVLVASRVSVPHPGRAVGPAALHKVVAPRYVAAPLHRVGVAKQGMQKTAYSAQPMKAVKSRH